MIGNFESIGKQTFYPNVNRTLGSRINCAFITPMDFAFATEADLESKAKWIEEIKAENIYPLNGLIELENQSEDSSYQKSGLGYEYEINRGKYIFTFKTAYRHEYHQNLESWAGKEVRVLFGDINNNIHGNQVGAAIRGFDMELINIEKKQFADDAVAWTVIRMILADATEYNYITGVSFRPNNFNVVFVVATEITGEANIIEFELHDTLYGLPINYFYKSDITIVDDEESLTVTSLEELSCGKFRVTASGGLTTGVINIDSDRLYGSFNYIITESVVIITDFQWYNRNHFRAKVELSVSGIAVTGLVLADFTITDDVAGVATVTGFTEVGAGVYDFVVTEDLVDGTVAVEATGVSGVSHYLVKVEVTLTVIPTFEDNISYMKVSAVTLLTAELVTTFVKADFSFADQYNGSFDLLGCIISSNEYALIPEGMRAKGILSVDNGFYFGSLVYDFTGVVIRNCNGTGTTRFVDTDLDGVADYLTVSTPSKRTVAIINANYMGISQQITVTVDGHNWPIQTSFFPNFIKRNKSYKLRFRYRTEGLIIPYAFKIYIQGSSSSYLNEDIPPSTGYYSDYESDVFTILSNEISIYGQLVISKESASVIFNLLEIIEV
jgi:hypothetical protein